MKHLLILSDIGIQSAACALLLFFSSKVLMYKRKETCHWIFLAILILLFLRIISYNLLIIPVLKNNNVLGIILYRIQSISVLFYPALFAHLFYLLLPDMNKKMTISIVFLYAFALIFYVTALTGVDSITKDLSIINEKIEFIINTSSIIYKTVPLYFVVSYVYSIRILNKLSKKPFNNKGKKTIQMLKYTYIIIFGYGYFIQFLLSLAMPKFLSLTSYLIIIFSYILYYTLTRYNFLQIYNSFSSSNITIVDFSVPYIITDDKGIITKSTLQETDTKLISGKKINTIFVESSADIEEIIQQKTGYKNLKVTFISLCTQMKFEWIVDFHLIQDSFNDTIGFFITITGSRISLESFSSREQEIIALLKTGVSYKMIAYELHISFNTVNTHIKNIYKKSGVNERKDLLKLLNTIPSIIKH